MTGLVPVIHEVRCRTSGRSRVRASSERRVAPLYGMPRRVWTQTGQPCDAHGEDGWGMGASGRRGRGP